VSAGSQRVVIAALAVNLLIAVFKFVAALLSRSTAMLAEAAHSLADCCNQVFLLIGTRRSARPPDDEHPFGYGPESYFWAFMVALSIFAIGAAFSVTEGVHKILHLRDPHEEGNAMWAIAVLGVSIVLESYSLVVALKEFRHIRAGRGIRRTLKEARDPTVLTVLFEDLAALTGLVFALGGVLLSHYTGNQLWDAIASILVGLVLGVVAWFLAADSKSLLIGEGATADDLARIRAVVRAHRDVVDVVHLRTMYLGPHEVIAAIKVRFLGNIDARRLEADINEIEASLRKEIPLLRRIYIEPGFDETRSRPVPSTDEAASG
jgi:cation diffusion facilitator family transporter